MARKPHKERRVKHKQVTSWLDDYGIKNPGMRAFLLAYVKVGTLSGACRLLGFGLQKIEFWRKGFTASKGKMNNPTPEGDQFEKALDEAKQRHVEALEFVLEQRAIRGSDNLLMFRLKGLKPDVYRESYRTQGPGGPPTPPGVQTQVNQLIQIGLQDPAKLAPMLELAQKFGLMDRLLGPADVQAAAAAVTGEPTPTTFKEVIKSVPVAEVKRELGRGKP